MRWPWSSRDRTAPIAGPRGDVERTPTAADRPVSAWSSLPPLQRLARALPLTSAPAAFAPGLASWRSPALTGTLARQVDPTRPPRLVLPTGSRDAASAVGGRGAVAMPVRGAARPSETATPLQRYSTEYAAADEATAAAVPIESRSSAGGRPGSGSALLSARPVELPVRQLVAEPLPPQPEDVEPAEEPAPSDGGDAVRFPAGPTTEDVRADEAPTREAAGAAPAERPAPDHEDVGPVTTSSRSDGSGSSVQRHVEDGPPVAVQRHTDPVPLPVVPGEAPVPRRQGSEPGPSSSNPPGARSDLPVARTGEPTLARSLDDATSSADVGAPPTLAEQLSSPSPNETDEAAPPRAAQGTPEAFDPVPAVGLPSSAVAGEGPEPTGADGLPQPARAATLIRSQSSPDGGDPRTVQRVAPPITAEAAGPGDAPGSVTASAGEPLPLVRRGLGAPLDQLPATAVQRRADGAVRSGPADEPARAADPADTEFVVRPDPSGQTVVDIPLVPRPSSPSPGPTAQRLPDAGGGEPEQLRRPSDHEATVPPPDHAEELVVGHDSGEDLPRAAPAFESLPDLAATRSATLPRRVASVQRSPDFLAVESAAVLASSLQPVPAQLLRPAPPGAPLRVPGHGIVQRAATGDGRPSSSLLDGSPTTARASVSPDGVAVQRAGAVDLPVVSVPSHPAAHEVQRSVATPGIDPPSVVVRRPAFPTTVDVPEHAASLPQVAARISGTEVGIPGTGTDPGTGAELSEDEEPATPPASTAPATGEPPGTPGTGMASPAGVEDLAHRLFDPLLVRLRGELLLERERRGLRTDAW